ncbi:aldehyde dehydrogenase family protein [Pendulispora albinea]|uniref:Aldehyde dehydrogenase family protein n=1 Tax=Pendulispora albinea TaxID=2741071 RepID=A0ABZ2M8V2_9BACT
MSSTRWNGRLYVGGEWRPASSHQTLASYEKATQRELGQQALATDRDLAAAVSFANGAQRKWAAAAYDVRAAVLRRVARLLEERTSEFADWIVRETGSIRGKAHHEIHASLHELQEAAALCSAPRAEVLPSRNTGKLSIVERVPVGLVGIITPWNFPLLLALRAVAPAVALGNAVLLKPAELTPITGGYLLAELFEDAGLPAGVLQVLPGLGEEIGDALVRHPDVPMIHFTGSNDVGQRIGSVAGGLLKKIALELGGNNAFVVLDDADVDLASAVGAWSSFHYQGQTCITAGRHIVMRAVAEPYTAALVARTRAIAVGDPSSSDKVGLGPMINEVQRDRALKLVAESVVQGATIAEGGTYDGLFVRPTVLTGVTPTMPIYTEEVFGPVAPVVVVDTEAEALALTNGTRYGLTNAVFTGDVMRGLAFAEQVRSGMVHVNDATCLDEAHVPFGGTGASGMGGRSGGAANLDEFTERRWIGVQRTPVAYPY